jgi:hypothetical protein
VEQEAFAAVEEAQAENVVVDERGDWVEDDVPEEGEGVAARFAAGYSEARHLGAVALHVFEVLGEGGVGVVEEVAVEAAFGAGVAGGAVGAGLVDHAGSAAPEETQFAVWVVTAVAHPAAEDLIAAVDPIGTEFGGGLEERADGLLEGGGEHFVGVEEENPVAGALVDGGVLLAAVAFEILGEYECIEGARDVKGAIGGVGVNDEDLVGEADGLEGARKVALFVHRDHGDGEGHGALREERDGGVGELLAEEALGEGAEVFAGFGQGEGLGRLIPLELEGGGERGDPDLADWGVGGEDELGGAVLKEDVENAVFLLGLKAAVFFGVDEGLLEGVEGFVGLAAESGFVDHAWSSVLACGRRPFTVERLRRCPRRVRNF